MKNMELVGGDRWQLGSAFRFLLIFYILNLWKSSELTWSCWFFLAVVYNFDGSVSHGLRLTIGETVHILEECAGEISVKYLLYKTSKVIFNNYLTCKYFLIGLSCYRDVHVLILWFPDFLWLFKRFTIRVSLVVGRKEIVLVTIWCVCFLRSIAYH